MDRIQRCECGKRINLLGAQFCNACLIEAQPGESSRRAWLSMSERERARLASFFIKTDSEITLDPEFLSAFEKEYHAH